MSYNSRTARGRTALWKWDPGIGIPHADKTSAAAAVERTEALTGRHPPLPRPAPTLVQGRRRTESFYFARRPPASLLPMRCAEGDGDNVTQTRTQRLPLTR